MTEAIQMGSSEIASPFSGRARNDSEGGRSDSERVQVKVIKIKVFGIKIKNQN